MWNPHFWRRSTSCWSFIYVLMKSVTQLTRLLHKRTFWAALYIRIKGWHRKTNLLIINRINVYTGRWKGVAFLLNRLNCLTLHISNSQAEWGFIKPQRNRSLSLVLESQSFSFLCWHFNTTGFKIISEFILKGKKRRK